jgi:two-component system, OmpR family, sensor kinase
MSSNPPTSPGRIRRWVRGWSLRARLTVILVGLLALVCLAVGVGTELALRNFLVTKLDDQLATAEQVAHHQPPGPFDTSDMDLGFLHQGQQVGTLGAEVVDGTVTKLATVKVPAGSRPTDNLHRYSKIETKTADTLAAVPVDGKAHTVDLGDLGQYRVVAFHPTADGDAVIVVGLPMATVNDTLVRMAVLEASVATLALLIGGSVGAFIVGGTLRPLRRVAATATRVAELPLDRGEVALSVRVPTADTDPKTEVGQVGAAINRMLGHVGNALNARHASEQRVRQFVADASHELRTPLAAIRGYAELTRRGRYELPADVTHAIGRVESESARMTTLVEDLLLLARLDSGRPLERETVDLTQLVADAVSDAHVAGPDHKWRLDLPSEPVTVTGDRARLHQVLANLLGNARAHTPPGTTVVTTLRADPEGRAVVSVRDDGPGIPAELLPNVFDRFARGDSARSRAAGSTGLGMAIVGAVVAAHYGTVNVASRPGRTEITVALPR